MAMKFIDSFSGIGGFHKGMTSAGFKCLFPCEIDSFARKSYCSIYDFKETDFVFDINDEKFEKKIKDLNINGDELIFCGGFPCQPFSRAGRRQSFDDANRGNLFFRIMQIVSQFKPRVVFLENVKGLLTAGMINPEHIGDRVIKHEVRKGSTFATILKMFDAANYDVEWQVINSSHFVPQKRERVYIIAHRRKGRQHGWVFPITNSSEDNFFNQHIVEREINPIEYAGRIQEILGDGLIIDTKRIGFFKFKEDTLNKVGLKGRVEKVFPNEDSRQNSPFENYGHMINGIIFTAHICGRNSVNLTQSLKNSGILLNDKMLLRLRKRFINKYPKAVERLNDEYKNSELKENEEEKQRKSKEGKIWKKSGHKMGNMRFPDNVDKPSRTLTANSSGREMMVIPINWEHDSNGNSGTRKLTTYEYWRLQGFSDDDYFKAASAVESVTQLKKQAGNAVTVTVIETIANRLKIGFTDTETLPSKIE